jgi:hypothetical protein
MGWGRMNQRRLRATRRLQQGWPNPIPRALGSLLLNVFATYLGSGGEEVKLEACMERSNCAWFPPVP